MTPEHEAAWEATVTRFTGGYGGPPDFSDATDQHCFMVLLEETLHARITASIVESFRRATARIEAQTAALTEARR